jgi:AcrR family transcriptional regulator
MTVSGRPSVKPRTTLNREQVLRAAMRLTDESGIEALSMRKLGQALGVEAMSLYNHVAGKDDLLDGMADLVWSEVRPPPPRGDWRAAIRKTAVSAHRLLLRHPWVCGLTIASGRVHPARLRYIDAILSRLRGAGLSAGLTYHAYHAIDSHILGFSMWVNGHDAGAVKRDEAAVAEALRGVAEELPHLAEHARQHRAGGYDTDEFTLILGFILDGLESRRTNG